MITLGRKKQVNCTDNVFYGFLGYVASHPDDIKIVFEDNKASGAWGNEGRIQFYTETARENFGSWGFGFTVGVGNTLYRLNCNELIQEMGTLGFVLGNVQNEATIKSNIPAKQHANFDMGTQM